MAVVGNCARRGIEPVQTRARGQPQHSGAILRNVHHCSAETAGLGRLDTEVGERLGSRIEAIQHLVTPYPQQARTVLEQRGDPGSGQAVTLQRVVHEHAELVAVIAIEAILSRKPHESHVALDDLGDPGL